MIHALLTAVVLAGVCIIWGILASRTGSDEAADGCGACDQQDSCSVPLQPRDERSSQCLTSEST